MKINSIRMRSVSGRLLQSMCAAILLNACGPSAPQVAGERAINGAAPKTAAPAESITTSETTDETVAYTEKLTIRTSDPSVQIIRLASPWGARPAEGLGTSEVSYTLTGDDHGIECNLDQLWVFTSDGQIFSPTDDVCEGWSLDLDVRSPPFDPSRLEILPVDMIWQHHTLKTDDDPVFAREHLSLSIPETDAGLISATCTTGSQWVDLTFYAGLAQSDDEDTQPPAISIAIGIDEKARLFHFQSDWSLLNTEGINYKTPSLKESIKHPFFTKLSSDFPMLLMIEGQPPVRMNHQDTAGAIESFRKACLAE